MPYVGFRLTVDDRPEVKYINRYVKGKVYAAGPEVWLKLGIELLEEKDVPALQTIKSNVTECSTRCSEMFKLWIERQPEASWRHLINAIRRINLGTLAFDIEKLFVTGKTSEEVATVDQQVLQADQQALGQSSSLQAYASQNGM